MTNCSIILIMLRSWGRIWLNPPDIPEEQPPKPPLMPPSPPVIPPMPPDMPVGSEVSELENMFPPRESLVGPMLRPPPVRPDVNPPVGSAAEPPPYCCGRSCVDWL